MNSPSKHKAYLALAITSFFWGSTWVVSKIGTQYISGLQIAYIRQFIAGSIFIIYFLIKGERLPTLYQFKWITLLAVIMFLLANGLSTWGVRFVPSGLAALIGALYPLFAVTIEALITRKALKSLTIIGLVAGILGIAVVFYENAFHAAPDGYVFGIILGITATLAWSIGTVIIARKDLKLNSYYSLGWQMFIGAFFTCGLAFATGNSKPLSQIPHEAWLVIVYLISFGSLLAFVAFLYTLQKLPTAIASLYAYINPIVAMFLGISFFPQEKITAYLLIGTAITLTGVYIVNYSMKKVKMKDDKMIDENN